MVGFLYFVGKFFQALLSPYSLAILLVGAAWVLVQRGRVLAARRCLAAVVLLLTIPAIPLVGDTLLGWLESRYPARPLSEYPNADAIVVLGGSVVATRPPRLHAEELHGARVTCASRLYRLGKADTVVASGGVPYTGSDGAPRAEADDLRDLLVFQGVPQGAVLCEEQSRNTYENALFTARLLREKGKKSVLLVTSAAHLPRATALFQAQGIEVIPVPNSFGAVAWDGDPMILFPTPSGLARTVSALKELVGLWVYQRLGRAA